MKPTAESVTAACDLTHKTAIVTGSSSGVGLELARVLALRGARVIFACRNVDKARAVIAAAALPDQARARCEIHACDLAVQSSVRALVAELVVQRRVVDLVALNAGCFGLPWKLTEDGLEYTFASNYAGHFVLLHGLLSHQLLAPSGRVLATLSENVRLNPFLRADLPMLLDPEQHRRRFGSYASPNAKVLMLLALLRCTREAATTPLAGASFDGCDPGGTLTDNVNQLGKVGGAIAKALAPLLFKPVEQGAAVLAWALTEPTLAGHSGRLFTSALREAKVPGRWADEKLAEAVWQATEQKLGLPGWPASKS